MSCPGRYPSLMDIQQILREIDAEIEKLQRARAILEHLSRPTKKKRLAKPKPARDQRPFRNELIPEPRLIVLPPKPKREYTRRIKVRITRPTALAAPLSTKPVFVPRAMEPALQTEKSKEQRKISDDALEAAMRRKLLGGAA